MKYTYYMTFSRSFLFLPVLALVFALSTSSAFASTTTFNSLLKVGSTGAEVTALQKTLTAQGFYSGPVNGKFGALTQTALKKFQVAHNIKAAGYTGPAT